MVTETVTDIKTTTALQWRDTAPEAEESDTEEDAIQTKLTYLIKDPKHENEKPYAIRYDAGNIPNTSMQNEPRPAIIHHFRPLQNSESFKDFGFSLERIDCELKAAEFNDDATVERVYYPAIMKLLRDTFPDAAEIKILEHGLRKRHPRFPAVSEEFVEFTQPATSIHIDFTPYSAARTARAAFNIEPTQYRRLLTVNFWKSFQGPGNDWPLALCDWRTIVYSSDTIATDVVFPDRFTENGRVYYNPKHQWYYFKDLGDDEVIMVRQTDSDVQGGGGVAHASFYNHKADIAAAPRTSIELRAFVFFV